MSQREKSAAFRALHSRAGAFVIANAWDAGSAKLLTAAGFEAIATTSLGFAATLGRVDGTVSRDEVLANCAQIVQATPLPVSADLENCYAREPRAAAATIALAAQSGLVGGSIEDATGSAAAPIYPFDQALERVRAAVAAARALPFPFTLTARAENFLYGVADLKDTIRRLEAFADAGADVLFAPGLTSLDAIATVVKAVSPKPVNAIMGLAGKTLSLAALEDIGVRRVSVGSALARAAFGEFLRAAQEIRSKGTFGFANQAIPFAEINAMFKRPRAG